MANYDSCRNFNTKLCFGHSLSPFNDLKFFDLVPILELFMNKYQRLFANSVLFLSAFAFCVGISFAQSPTVLLVDAHPDDESGSAATIYKITHDLHGKVDLAVITNGEGGYKYSTLAEAIYGVELTDEQVGREYLPTIRKNELVAGGKIIGLRNYFYFDQTDTKYTLDPDSVLTKVWNISFVKSHLRDIILKGNYDYIFCLLPTEDTHGHHKAATILALETVSEMTGKKPIVLGVSGGKKNDTTAPFTGLKKFPITAIKSGKPSFEFDKTVKFGFKNSLDYKIIVNWLIAEHKSQGAMQLGMNYGEIEKFWFFDINDSKDFEPTKNLFERLKIVPYKSKTY